MTKSEWESCINICKMIDFVSISPRKRRLFEVACAKHISHLIEDHRAKVAIEVAEGYVDGKFSEEDLNHAYKPYDIDNYMNRIVTISKDEARIQANNAGYLTCVSVFSIHQTNDSCRSAQNARWYNEDDGPDTGFRYAAEACIEEGKWQCRLFRHMVKYVGR